VQYQCSKKLLEIYNDLQTAHLMLRLHGTETSADIYHPRITARPTEKHRRIYCLTARHVGQCLKNMSLPALFMMVDVATRTAVFHTFFYGDQIFDRESELLDKTLADIPCQP